MEDEGGAWTNNQIHDDCVSATKPNDLSRAVQKRGSFISVPPGQLLCLGARPFRLYTPTADWTHTGLTRNHVADVDAPTWTTKKKGEFIHFKCVVNGFGKVTGGRLQSVGHEQGRAGLRPLPARAAVRVAPY